MNGGHSRDTVIVHGRRQDGEFVNLHRLTPVEVCGARLFSDRTMWVPDGPENLCFPVLGVGMISGIV